MPRKPTTKRARKRKPLITVTLTLNGKPIPPRRKPRNARERAMYASIDLWALMCAEASDAEILGALRKEKTRCA